MRKAVCLHFRGENMSLKKGGKIGGPTYTKVIYVGVDRFKVLCDEAIKISYEGGRQVTASQLAQYLVDNFTDVAKQRLLKEMLADT
jgi:hypothetical protein